MLYSPKILRNKPQMRRHQFSCLMINRTRLITHAVVTAVVCSIKSVVFKAALLGMALFANTHAMALAQPTAVTAPNNTTVPVNLTANPNANFTPNLTTNQNQSLPVAANNGPESQVATPPTTPFLKAQNNQLAPTNQLPSSVAPLTPIVSSLADSMQPSATALSAANQKLLSQNAKLQREVNDLSTQVNVLINERSGQLFIYGAITVTVSLILGFLFGAFIFGRRERW